MMYWSGHMTTDGWIIAILWTATIFALIAGAIYWLASALTGRSPEASGTVSEPPAREILDRRLPTGELTLEQYTELRDAIVGGTSSSGAQPQASQPASAPG
jgi:uncharacterized membrane protein